ncbi:GGDEF domain-containing protein [Iodidimonas muriae]|uniref:diguanylate cyclase n=1 Tax=Iodidimonas muriae TaxID=261467 RepID=A0ABQ2LEG5_9PROT|nr:GGDEF domain-containing protein [Iodidimonas muriae]GER07558.1 GGDEF domain-containing protein [Kordiimonadales bacterium JCM 17843]GGO13946.1 GGDEF domain-containing protein [Iodidimonas muriae]
MTADGLDQANEFAQSALQLMERFHIPPTPQNYQIWYNYAAGRDPELNSAINILISNKRDFTETRCAEIAEQFFGIGRGSKEVHEATERLHELATTIIKHVSTAKKGSAHFGKQVATISSDAKNVSTTEEIERLALGLIKEARVITEMSATIEKNLNTTGGEITALRRSLTRMRKEATTDPLTGLANRREFNNFLQTSAVISGETGAPMSLIMFDIDHFKHFNDQYGHRIGDEALKIVASKLKLVLKGKDLPVRYGGEEFIAVLPETPLEDAQTVAEHIRTALSGSNLKNRVTGEHYGKITASFGIAAFSPGESLEDFVQRADEALYRAKRDGRNRVEIATDSDLQHHNTDSISA